MLLFEADVAHLVQGDKMDMRMWDLQPDYGYPDAQAWHGSTQGCGHGLGEDHHPRQLIGRQVEDVIHLCFGNHQGMALRLWAHIEEGQEFVVFGNFICGDFPAHNPAEN